MTLDEILKNGFPTTREENWKYTSVSVLSTKPVLFSSNKAVAFNNHQQPGIKISSENTSLKTNADVFENLNQYFNTESYSITITENLAQPLEIIYESKDTQWVQPKITIKLAKNVSASVIEIFQGTVSHVMNVVTDIQVCDGGKLQYYKIQSHDLNTIHIGRTHIDIHKNAFAQTFTLSKGSQLARSDINVKFIGEHARCELYGLSYSKHRQHLDQHTVIDHAVGHCTSNEFYRSVLDDKSRVVFNGKVIVRENAHHSEANQANHTILLSSDAEVDTKPELEIYYDDVKCTHGATIGQLDDEAMFYLRSRGLSEDAARKLLIDAFGNKVIQSISDEKMRERLCQY
ncbi:MAG: Fe-S cluster assembly protein SufD [Gammaproteobacteria bacterium]|nr:Fe-S cluster assembly protein SufD [Gammaproteobacteria bacterium]